MALPIGLFVADEPDHEIDVVELLKCTVDVPGFYSSGNCKKVLRAYREFKAIQAS